jgi:hypothetical protein
MLATTSGRHPRRLHRLPLGGHRRIPADRRPTVNAPRADFLRLKNGHAV